MAFSSATFLLILIAVPFGGSCLAALFPANARNAEAYLAGGVALTAVILVVALYPQVVNGGVVYWRTPWIPELGLDFNLRMDGFAWVLAVLLTGIGFLVVLYARYYMSPADGASLLLIPAGSVGPTFGVDDGRPSSNHYFCTEPATNFNCLDG